ncbi:MAG: acetylglutamate kinase, partial [Halobacteriota archaeon]
VIAVEDGRKRVLRGDHSGKIENVNADLLRGLVDDGYTPVVGVPMVTYDDVAVNADADRAAAAVAGALDARLLLLTDVPGVLRDVDDRDSLLREVGRDDVDDVLERYAVGRMKKKVLAAREALDSGAPAASISSANDDEPVRHALEGGGTVFTA